MEKKRRIIKIVFAIFAASLITAAILFNLEIEKGFYIAILAVIVSAIALGVPHRNS